MYMTPELRIDAGDWIIHRVVFLIDLTHGQGPDYALPQISGPAVVSVWVEVASLTSKCQEQIINIDL